MRVTRFRRQSEVRSPKPRVSEAQATLLKSRGTLFWGPYTKDPSV